MNNPADWDVPVELGVRAVSTAESPPLHEQAVHGVAWSLIRLLVALLSSAAIVVAARSLGPFNTGAYSYALWVVATIVAVGALSFPDATVKYVSEFLGAGNEDRARQVARRLVSIQFVTVVTIAVGSCAVRLTLFRDVSWTLWLLGSIIAIAMTVDNATGAVLEGVRRFDQTAYASLAGAIAQVTGIVLSAVLHWGLTGMLGGVAAGTLVSMGFRLHASRRLLLGSFAIVRPDKYDPLGPRIRSFSFTASLILIISILLWQRSEFFVVQRFLGYAEIGFYAIAYGIAVKVIQIGDALTHPLMPFFSNFYGERGAESLAGHLPDFFKYVTMIMAPISLAGFVLAAPAIQILFGERFLPAAPALRLLLLGAPASACAVVVLVFLYAVDKTGAIAIGSACLVGVKLVLAVTLIPRYAIVGAALTNVVPQVCALAIGLPYIAGLVKARIPLSAALRVYVLAVLAFVPAIVSAWLHASVWMSLMFAGLGGLAYGTLLLRTGQLRTSDWTAIRKLVHRHSG